MVTYIFNFTLEVVGVITVFHDKHYLFLGFCVVKQLYDVIVVEGRVDGAFLLSIGKLGGCD